MENARRRTSFDDPPLIETKANRSASARAVPSHEGTFKEAYPTGPALHQRKVERGNAQPSLRTVDALDLETLRDADPSQQSFMDLQCAIGAIQDGKSRQAALQATVDLLNRVGPDRLPPAVLQHLGRAIRGEGASGAHDPAEIERLKAIALRATDSACARALADGLDAVPAMGKEVAKLLVRLGPMLDANGRWNSSSARDEAAAIDLALEERRIMQRQAASSGSHVLRALLHATAPVTLCHWVTRHLLDKVGRQDSDLALAEQVFKDAFDIVAMAGEGALSDGVRSSIEYALHRRATTPAGDRGTAMVPEIIAAACLRLAHQMKDWDGVVEMLEQCVSRMVSGSIPQLKQRMDEAHASYLRGTKPSPAVEVLD